MDKLSIPNKMQSIEEVHKALKEIEMFVNNLSSSVATEAETEISDITGKTGDIQITQNADKSYTFEVRTEEGWKTPVIGETSVKFKDKPSDRSKPNNESIESIATEDESTGGSRANLNIFDEQNNKFVLPRPDYDSGWVENGGDRTHGTHTLNTIPSLVQIYWSNDEGVNVHTLTYTISGSGNELWLTSTTWSIQGNTNYGYYRETTSGTSFTAIANQGHFKVLLWK
jgi:hypothetical protein